MLVCACKSSWFQMSMKRMFSLIKMKNKRKSKKKNRRDHQTKREKSKKKLSKQRKRKKIKMFLCLEVRLILRSYSRLLLDRLWQSISIGSIRFRFIISLSLKIQALSSGLNGLQFIVIILLLWNKFRKGERGLAGLIMILMRKGQIYKCLWYLELLSKTTKKLIIKIIMNLIYQKFLKQNHSGCQVIKQKQKSLLRKRNIMNFLNMVLVVVNFVFFRI